MIVRRLLARALELADWYFTALYSDGHADPDPLPAAKHDPLVCPSCIANARQSRCLHARCFHVECRDCTPPAKGGTPCP